MIKAKKPSYIMTFFNYSKDIADYELGITFKGLAEKKAELENLYKGDHLEFKIFALGAEI